MGKIHEEDKSEQDEEHSTDESNIVAPEAEEAFRNEECQDNEGEPDDDFGTPISIL